LKGEAGVLQNQPLQSLLQKLSENADQSSPPQMIQDPFSPLPGPDKKRKGEDCQRGQEELQKICKVQRMQRNRESAARSRSRKREYIEELELKLASLATEVNSTELFKERIARLEAENQTLRIQLEHFQIQHNSQPVSLQYSFVQPPFQQFDPFLVSPAPQFLQQQQFYQPQQTQEQPQEQQLQEQLQEQVLPPQPQPQQQEEEKPELHSPVSFVLNTPPESPTELSSHQFNKYATLFESSPQLEKETIPLLISLWVQIWLTLLIGVETKQTEKRMSLTISLFCWTSCLLNQAQTQSTFFERITQPTSCLLSNAKYFHLPP